MHRKYSFRGCIIAALVFISLIVWLLFLMFGPPLTAKAAADRYFDNTTQLLEERSGVLYVKAQGEAWDGSAWTLSALDRNSEHQIDKLAGWAKAHGYAAVDVTINQYLSDGAFHEVKHEFRSFDQREISR